MSMDDDIFDLEYMMKEKKKPTDRDYRSWERIMSAFNTLETENELLRVMKSNLNSAISIANSKL